MKPKAELKAPKVASLKQERRCGGTQSVSAFFFFFAGATEWAEVPFWPSKSREHIIK